MLTLWVIRMSFSQERAYLGNKRKIYMYSIFRQDVRRAKGAIVSDRHAVIIIALFTTCQ